MEKRTTESLTEDELQSFIEGVMERKTKNLFHNVFYEPYKRTQDSYCLPDIKVTEGVTCELGLPVPPARTMRGYGPDPDIYLRSGKANAEKMLELMEKNGRPLKNTDKILDFGCGAGRMTRWLGLLGDGEDYYGVDVLGEDVFWAKQNLGEKIKFFMNIRLPHLQFEDNFFDFIFAGSVFSHIDDLTEAWLMELKRVTKPGGYLYLTLLDENSIDILSNKRRDHLEKDVFANREDHIIKYDNFCARDYGMFNIRRSQIQSLRAESPQTFYHSNYFKKLAGQFFEIAGYEQNAYGYQSAAILKK